MSDSLSIRLGPYELVEQIAQGAYGEVYKAKHVGPAGFQRIFAIKRLKRHVMADPSAVRAFENEARIGGVLLHHNIAQTLEFAEHAGHYYIVMEYVDGVSLQGIIAYHKSLDRPVPPAVALELIAQSCDGLHYAHEAKAPDGQPLNLVHRDIKPSNLMLTRDGVVKVMDFGIARVDNQTLTDAGFIKGTPRYLSPEVIGSGDNVDRRSDLFSLGTVLYELIALNYLFDAPNILTLMSLVRGASVKKQLKAAAKIDKRVSKMLARVLTASADARFATAREMARELRRHRRDISRDDVDLEGFAQEVKEGLSNARPKNRTDKPPSAPSLLVRKAPKPDPDPPEANVPTVPPAEPPLATFAAPESAPNVLTTGAEAGAGAGAEKKPRFSTRSLADRPPVLPEVRLKTTSIQVNQLVSGFAVSQPTRLEAPGQTPPTASREQLPPHLATSEQKPPPISKEQLLAGDSSPSPPQGRRRGALNLLPDGLPSDSNDTPSPMPASQVTSLFGDPAEGSSSPTERASVESEETAEASTQEQPDPASVPPNPIDATTERSATGFSRASTSGPSAGRKSATGSGEVELPTDQIPLPPSHPSPSATPVPGFTDLPTTQVRALEPSGHGAGDALRRKPGDGRRDKARDAPPDRADSSSGELWSDREKTAKQASTTSEWDPDSVPTHMIDLRAVQGRRGEAAAIPPAGIRKEQLGGATPPPAEAPAQAAPEFMPSKPSGQGPGKGPASATRPTPAQGGPGQEPPMLGRRTPAAMLKTQISATLETWVSDFDDDALPSSHHHEELSLTVAKPREAPESEHLDLRFGEASSLLPDEDLEEPPPDVTRRDGAEPARRSPTERGAGTDSETFDGASSPPAPLEQGIEATATAPVKLRRQAAAQTPSSRAIEESTTHQKEGLDEDGSTKDPSGSDLNPAIELQASLPKTPLEIRTDATMAPADEARTSSAPQVPAAPLPDEIAQPSPPHSEEKNLETPPGVEEGLEETAAGPQAFAPMPSITEGLEPTAARPVSSRRRHVGQEERGWDPTAAGPASSLRRRVGQEEKGDEATAADFSFEPELPSDAGIEFTEVSLTAFDELTDRSSELAEGTPVVSANETRNDETRGGSRDTDLVGRIDRQTGHERTSRTTGAHPTHHGGRGLPLETGKIEVSGDQPGPRREGKGSLGEGKTAGGPARSEALASWGTEFPTQLLVVPPRDPTAMSPALQGDETTRAQTSNALDGTEARPLPDGRAGPGRAGSDDRTQSAVAEFGQQYDLDHDAAAKQKRVFMIAGGSIVALLLFVLFALRVC